MSSFLSSMQVELQQLLMEHQSKGNINSSLKNDISLKHYHVYIFPILFLKKHYQCPWLEGIHVVFGRIESGMDVVKAIEGVGSVVGRPRMRIKIVVSGVIA